MITTDYVRLMAAYNSEMNRRIYAGAGKLSDEERRKDIGLFFKSLHGTLNHLLWGDRVWMARFDNWPPCAAPKGGASLYDDFGELTQARIEADAKLEDFAQRIDDAWLQEDLVWFSGAAGRELRRPKSGLIVHLFNHQTHHRGQAHAALTSRGIDPGDTDLFLVVNRE